MNNTFQIEIPNRDIGRNKDIDPTVVVRSLKSTTLDWAGFERHLMSGQPYSFNRIARKKGRRHASGFQQASHIAMDSDKNATLAEILNPVNPLAKHIRYVAPSPSDMSTYRKLRVIFPLAQPISDKFVLTSTLRLISDEFLRFGVRFDPACLDPCRWYYAKEVSEIADFELNSLTIPSEDFQGILRLPACQALDLSILADFAGELEHRQSTPTIHITELDTFADLLENELRQAGVLLDRRDGVNSKTYSTLKLTHCHTSTEHAEKDNESGAYSHANLTIWDDGGLTYHCYGGTCANKGIHHFLRKFNIKNKELKTALEESTRKSNYTPQLLVPQKYPNHLVVNERYLSDAIEIPEIDERLIILDSALGTGKTECLKNYVEFCRDSDLTVLTVIPRRTLGTQASLRFDVVDYQGENREERTIVRSRTICIPSLNTLIADADSGDIPEYDVLLIDEPSKVLQFFTAQGQGLFNSESPATHALECAKGLMEIGRKAKKIVIAEACMNQRVAWLFRRMFDISLDDVRVVKNEYQENLSVTLWGITDEIRKSELYAEVELFFAEIKRPWETPNRFRDWMKQAMLSEAVTAAGDKNIPLVIACDEKEDGAHGVRRFLIDAHGFSFDDILLVTSETKDSTQVHAFLADPNGFIQTQHPRAIIHTAAMETGFSIEEPCGVVVLADGHNHTLDACALLQMIGRCRKPAFIHCLLDDRFRSENTDSEELIAHLITNHKYLEAKHKLNNQRLSDYQAWINEIHGQLTAEPNRQRMRLIESVPAFLEANGYDLQWIDPKAMIKRGCDFDGLVGDESLLTALAIREERITRQETIIESEAISPDVASQHRRKKTLDESLTAGEKKGKLLELSGAEWIDESEGKLKSTLKYKRETAGLLKFVEKSSFDGEGKAALVPTGWCFENRTTGNTNWTRLQKTKEFIISSTFLKDIDKKSDESWLSDLFVNNAVKQLKLHKPRNRRRLDAFCDFHTEPATLVDWDIGEVEGATPIRAFKDPRRQIADYVKRLIEQIGEKSATGMIWIREWDQTRLNGLGFELKSTRILNIDRYIQARFDKDSAIEGFTISELVGSYFKSTSRLVDRGDYLGVCRQVLYDYFYRIDAEYNTPLSDEKLFSLLPSISRKYEVKRTDEQAYAILDAKSCMTTLKRSDSKIETVVNCLEWLGNWQVDGKSLGLVWFAATDEKHIVGVPCRVYRNIAIDTELENLLLALRDTPLSENTATNAEIQRVKDHIKSTANFQKAQKTRTDALARIESVIKDAAGPLSIGEIANELNLELDESKQKAIQRRLTDLLRQEKIAKTGLRASTKYFTVSHEKEEEETGAEVSLRTKSSFCNREDLIQNDDFVLKESNEIAEGSGMPVSDQAILSTKVETKSGTVFDKHGRLTGDICYVVNDDMISDALGRLGDASTIGLDFETYADCGIDDPLYVKKASPRALSVSDGTRAVVFDCADLSLLPEKLRGWLASKTVVCHNAQFDLAFLSRWDIKPKQVIDTMLIESVVLGAEGEKGSRSLSTLCEKYLNKTLDKTAQQADWSVENVLTEEMIQYAATDATVLIPLRDTLDKKIRELGMDERAYQIFCDAVPAFVESKLVGMPIDTEKTQRLHERLKADAERIERGVILDYGQYGYTTANSSKKISRVIQQAFQEEVQSTSRETLTQLALDTDKTALVTFCEHVLAVRRLTKTATELANYISSAVDGRIHANYRLGGAISGRTTSSNPNLQQVSKTAAVNGLLETGEIRSCFVAPEGYQFVTADFSQIELVLNAIHCVDDQMLQAFRDGTDIHSHTASQIFGKPLVEVSKKERQIGKSANFGLQYGMGTDGFRDYALSRGIRLSQAEAGRIRRAWFESYPQIAVHHSQVKSQKPQTVRTITGRVIRPKRFTDALNLPIQGSGADLLNRAIAIIHDRLEPFDASIVTFVHDELVVLVSEAETGAVAEVVKRGMVEAGKDLYPEYQKLIQCDVEIRQDWSGLSGQNPASDSNAVGVRDAYEPVEDEPAQVNPDIPVAVPPTQRKPVDDNRGNLFLPDIPAEPQIASTPKAASTDRRETERKPKNDAVKSDADRLLDVWEQKHPYEMHHREQVIDMAIYAGLFSAESGREAKWEAIKPALIRWEDEGKITAWLGGMYQINPLRFRI